MTAHRTPLPGALFRAAHRRFADRECLVCEGRVWTYAEVDAASDRLAHALAARGIGAGDVVALYMRNAAEYVVADMAIFKLG
ncbi:MAG: AMP-binding protein, partial [Pseudomonadota bacterium]